MSPFDTIVAPISGHQRAAVALLRLSGPEAYRVAAGIFDPWPDPVESHRAQYGRFITGDDGLVLPFAEGRSYTGEWTVELMVHGSPVGVRLLLEACLAQGARMAAPGEFTQRAFMNGRIDLSQAEAVRDTIEAETAVQLRAANQLREGWLKRKVSGLRDETLALLAQLEASVDFSEEIGEFDRGGAGSRLDRLVLDLDQLFASAESGRLLRAGYRIALVGQPNAGKSSLMNALLRSDRALVTEIPGTTRDYLEEKVELGGVPCVLVDTAGLRETEDVVERLGVERTLDQVQGADAVWLLYDASLGWTSKDEALRTQLPPDGLAILANKCDLAPPNRGIPISARTGQGLDTLERWIQERVGIDPAIVPIQLRHEEPLREARESLALARNGLDDGIPEDVLSSAFRVAIRALGEVTGETLDVDMVDRIFRDFCIGK